MAVLEGKELEKALLAFCKAQGSVPDPAKVASEDQFAKGIGGSKADHVAEKMFAEVLRDPNQAAAGEGSAFEQWLNGSSAEAGKVRDGKKAPPPSDYAQGKWIRTLNAQETCYLYVHTTTYQMQGTRPEDYVGEADAGPKVDPWASFPSCTLDGLKGGIDELWDKNRSALLLADGDANYEKIKEALKESGAMFFDIKPFVWGVIKTKIKFADHVETARQTLVTGMKKGVTVVIDLADVGTPDWKEKICSVEAHKKVFPIWMLDPSSHKEVDKHGQVFKKDDKKDVDGEDWDEALAKSIKDYRMVYLCASGPGNYEKDLTLEYLPQNKWSALRVKCESAPVREINLKSLVTAIDEVVHASGKVPLVLDESENTDTFMAFQHTSVIEMKGLILKKSTIGRDGVLEEMRKKLVEALKNGNTLLLRLTNTAPDLLADYDSAEHFPVRAVFECRTEEIEEEEEVEQQKTGFGGIVGETAGGVAGYAQGQFVKNIGTKGVFKVAEKEIASKVYRDEDKESGICVVRPGFKVVVTSNYSMEQIKERLKGIPLASCEVIKISE